MCDSAAGVFVSVTMLAVGVDAVAKLHAQRAVSERGRVGATERARPLGVGVDVFGLREFFVREASAQHEFHPLAVTQGLMRHDRVRLPEDIVKFLQLDFKITFVYFLGELVRDCVSGRRRVSIRKAKDYIRLKPRLSRDTHP